MSLRDQRRLLAGLFFWCCCMPAPAGARCGQKVFNPRLATSGPHAMAIDEELGRAVITFYDELLSSDPYPSRAQVYERVGDTWQYAGLIRAEERIHSFGASIAMHGERVIIGADETIPDSRRRVRLSEGGPCLGARSRIP